MSVPSAVAGLLRRPARLGDEVYSAIFERIMSLEIEPGARISVDAMARQLGVSQTPIREALARLESEGLVRKTHLVGYSASPQLDARQVDELYQLRLLLEPFVAGQCALLMSDIAIGQLSDTCEHMQALAPVASLNSYAKFAQLDMIFHDQLAASAGNSLIVDALGRMHTHVHLFRLVLTPQATDAAIAEHVAIVAGISDRDPARATAAMRAHIEHSRKRFERD
jgi:DNA-binding GntR family transcriptional regulator